jgi:DNA (cytosine-5)-methyltransferase 1
MAAYYNEWDKNAAAWLRELIKMGLIAYGEVDERSITDVEANELRGFNQCHFFAGIGGWSLALRLANVPDDYPVWTASLPCQPFSVAGRGKGKDDERHLLPHFLELVRQCKPDRIFGEQVEGAIRHGWLDDLQTTMEAENYSVGHCVLGAHSVGSYHQRQRLYWVANAAFDRREQRPADNECGAERNSTERTCRRTAFGGDADGLADSKNRNGRTESRFSCSYAAEPRNQSGRCGESGRMCDTESNEEYAEPTRGLHAKSGNERYCGIWSNPEWLYCRDNKYRPVKPGIAPLVAGIPRGMVRSGDISQPINANETSEARVMRLKGYGNAIVPQVAAEFISAFMDVA